jgi:threonine-phosphate decarboxylase
MGKGQVDTMSHRHGGDPSSQFQRLGVPPRSVLDFSVNVNPLGLPGEVLDAWPGLAAEMGRYPSIGGDGVRRFYERRFGLSPDSILPGNGSIESIYLAPRALRFKRCVLLSPCFHDYGPAARLAGAEVRLLPLSAADDFAPLSAEEIEEGICGADAVFMGNPNNPTGTTFGSEAILHLAEAYPDTWFLVDEAFAQFAENHEETTLMSPERLRPNVLVLHSLTKFYALPGLRLGAAIGHPATIGRLKRFKEPWTVNRVAERVAELLIGCRDYEERSRRFVHAENQRVSARLRRISGIRAFPASVNFLLAQWTVTGDLDDLLRALLAAGLCVRDCRNFPGLERNYFRFAIRAAAENDRLMDAIAQCAEAHDA